MRWAGLPCGRLPCRAAIGPSDPALRTPRRSRGSPTRCLRWRTRRSRMRWPGLAPRSSEIDAFVRTSAQSAPLPRGAFLVSERRLNWNISAQMRQSGSRSLIITRRAFTVALSLTGLATLVGFSPLHLITEAMAQTSADVAKPQSLPDMALGPKDAKVTIYEYASMTCPHCAAFNSEVFPKLKKEYI